MRRRLVIAFVCVLLGAMLILGVAWAGRAHEESEVFACSAVGCDSGVAVAAPDVAYARPEVAKVRLCIAGRCRVVSRFAEGVIGDSRRVGGRAAVPVMAALLDARGRVVARDEALVARRKSAPNGERCGPICYYGGVHFTPGGRLVRPSGVRLPPRGRPGIDVIVRGRVSRLRARRAASARLVVRRGDPIEVRTDSRSYVRVYVRGHLPPTELEPFGLAGPGGRVWDAWVPRRLRGARELMVRLDHRRDRRVVRFRLPIEVIS